MGVAAAAVGQDQQFPGLCICLPALLTPPMVDAIGGELGGVRGRAHGHCAAVFLGIVDRVGRGPTLGVGNEVVGVDPLGFPAPGGAGIFEIAHQFLLLGVHADHRLAGRREGRAMLLNVLELRLSVRTTDLSIFSSPGL